MPNTTTGKRGMNDTVSKSQVKGALNKIVIKASCQNKNS